MGDRSPARRRLELIDMDTGEVHARKPRTPHAFDGKGYTLEGHGVEVPNFRLNLSGTEWDVIDWMRQHGGSARPLRVLPREVAPQVCSTENTVKTAIKRLVTLNLMLRIGGPRSGTYQLNPRRFWEGSGDAHVKACIRLDPPPIVPDAKAAKAALKAAEKAAETAAAAVATAEEADLTTPGSLTAVKAATAAEHAAESARLAIATAVRLGAKIPLQLRRLVKEDSQ